MSSNWICLNSMDCCVEIKSTISFSIFWLIWCKQIIIFATSTNQTGIDNFLSNLPNLPTDCVSSKKASEKSIENFWVEIYVRLIYLLKFNVNGSYFDNTKSYIFHTYMILLKRCDGLREDFFYLNLYYYVNLYFDNENSQKCLKRLNLGLFILSVAVLKFWHCPQI